MSRIGKLPINIPEGVRVSVSERSLAVEGPKGRLAFALPDEVGLKIENNVARVAAKNPMMSGLVRAHLANAIVGVTKGFSRNLELSGTGFRVAVSGQNLQLSLGFSHQVVITAPDGINFSVKDNVITVSGSDKSLVGEVAAKIRATRPADPYKAKGLKYEGEVIARKAGKTAKTGGGK